jgi:hypothetical protein
MDCTERGNNNYYYYYYYLDFCRGIESDIETAAHNHQSKNDFSCWYTFGMQHLN